MVYYRKQIEKNIMRYYYFVDTNHKPQGPYSQDVLLNMIQPNTLVWAKDMPNWVPANSIPELASHFTNNSPTPPPMVVPIINHSESIPQQSVSTTPTNVTDSSDWEDSIKSQSKRKIWIIALAVVFVLVAVVGAFSALSGKGNSSSLDSAQDSTNLMTTMVENDTITLSKGHESKRNFVYSGSVDEDGLPHGQGVAHYFESQSDKSSASFEGVFEHGITSDGVMEFSSGEMYKGTFTSDGFFNEGTWWEKDGYYFTGTFKNGNPYNGTWYSPSGKEDGKIVNGQ